MDDVKDETVCIRPGVWDLGLQRKLGRANSKRLCVPRDV